MIIQITCFIRTAVDPIIEIITMGIKKYSTTKKDIGPTGIVHWSEHLFFEPRKVVRISVKLIQFRM